VSPPTGFSTALLGPPQVALSPKDLCPLQCRCGPHFYILLSEGYLCRISKGANRLPASGETPGSNTSRKVIQTSGSESPKRPPICWAYVAECPGLVRE